MTKLVRGVAGLALSAALTTTGCASNNGGGDTSGGDQTVTMWM